MRAIVIEESGGPEKLLLREIPAPEPVAGRVLIRIKAFGLNRSEWFTRRGDSPSVKFPRVLGIECVGVVVAAPGTDLSPGQTVAAMMGGMGRAFDGSYAELTSVPREHVFPLATRLDWATLGAIPEMFQTVNGSLSVGLEIERARTLLIRGGTSSIGLTAALLASRQGLVVASTTRNPDRAAALREAGATHVIPERGAIADQVREVFPGGVDRVLELVGATTLLDSLRAARPGGIVCMTGILGGQWALSSFLPMEDIPTGVKLTSYSGGSEDLRPEDLQRFVSDVERGAVPIRVARTFRLDQIQEAHRVMDANEASGKMVVVVDV
jgi:NADPH:quinone reductase-like Zn-dependent oxidoreductase